MEKYSKEIYKNIGEAFVDTAMTAFGVATFGISTNLVDLGDKVIIHYHNSQRVHAIKQLKYFYDTPSRLWNINMQNFKEKYEDHQEIVLDLLKTLDLTIHKKQSEMLARLFECYILDEITTNKFHHLKYIVVKLDQYLLNKLEEYLPDDTITNRKFDLEYESIGFDVHFGDIQKHSEEEVSYDRKINKFFGNKNKNPPQEFINFEFYEAIDMISFAGAETMPQQEYKPTRFFLWFVTHILRDNN